MLTKHGHITKVVLVGLLLSLGLVLLPASSAAAAAEPEDARLEELYTQLTAKYERQSAWMDKADANIVRIQNLIDKAAARGFDTSAVQAALDTFSAVYPQARLYNQQAGEILDAHEGFNGSGKVMDREQAIATLKSVRDALKAAYDTMGGEEHAGRLLMEAVKAFVESIRPLPGS